jgi:hypothetical protein
LDSTISKRIPSSLRTPKIPQKTQTAFYQSTPTKSSLKTYLNIEQKLEILFIDNQKRLIFRADIA